MEIIQMLFIPLIGTLMFLCPGKHLYTFINSCSFNINHHNSNQ